jgi:hypothetical protein
MIKTEHNCGLTIEDFKNDKQLFDFHITYNCEKFKYTPYQCKKCLTVYRATHMLEKHFRLKHTILIPIKDCNILTNDTWGIVYSYLHKTSLFDGKMSDISHLYEMLLSNNIEILKCMYIKNNFTMSGLYDKLKTCIKIYEIHGLYVHDPRMMIFETWLLLSNKFNLTKQEYVFLDNNDLFSNIMIIKNIKISNIFFNIVKKNEEMYMYMYERIIHNLTTRACFKSHIKYEIYKLEYLLDNIFNINDDIDKKIYKILILRKNIVNYEKDVQGSYGTGELIEFLKEKL